MLIFSFGKGSPILNYSIRVIYSVIFSTYGIDVFFTLWKNIFPTVVGILPPCMGFCPSILFNQTKDLKIHTSFLNILSTYIILFTFYMGIYLNVSSRKKWPDHGGLILSLRYPGTRNRISNNLCPRGGAMPSLWLTYIHIHTLC